MSWLSFFKASEHTHIDMAKILFQILSVHQYANMSNSKPNPNRSKIKASWLRIFLFCLRRKQWKFEPNGSYNTEWINTNVWSRIEEFYGYERIRIGTKTSSSVKRVKNLMVVFVHRNSVVELINFFYSYPFLFHMNYKQ